jgi:hypothetical protein
MKWPKEWRNALERWVLGGTISEDVFNKVTGEMLDALHKAGALKDPPKPREIYVCDSGCGVKKGNPGWGSHAADCATKKWVKYVEVKDE